MDIEEAKRLGDWAAVLKAKITNGSQRTAKKRDWVVLRDTWLTSSINYRMEPNERAAFVALILLAAKQGPIAGLISDNDLRPVPYQYLADLAHIPLAVVKSCIKKGMEDDSMFEDEHGLFLTHFDEYQFTEYDRQKPYRQAKREREVSPEEVAAYKTRAEKAAADRNAASLAARKTEKEKKE